MALEMALFLMCHNHFKSPWALLCNIFEPSPPLGTISTPVKLSGLTHYGTYAVVR